MKSNPLPRLDRHPELRERLLGQCRLGSGDIWSDPHTGHRVGCLDAADADHVAALVQPHRATLAVHDPPYNLVAFQKRCVGEYIEFCRRWIALTVEALADDASIYIWLGADQNAGFQPLPEFMLMMRQFPQLKSRSMITLRNQRGYGTQQNWMAVRQELLMYTRGKPAFSVQYTDIPKILAGYYKQVNGQLTENIERGKSRTIRPGNVWVDVQQVFYRMEENVSPCFAQKPLKAVERIVEASSQRGDTVLDFFAHAGSTLIACERLGRRCLTMDIDPVFCEITIRRWEHFRQTGKLGWQNGHPFEDVPGLNDVSDCKNGNKD